MRFLSQSLHMGLTLESRTKEVDIGHIVVDGLEAWNNYEDINSLYSGPTLFLDVGDEHGGCDGSMVDPTSFVLVLIFSKLYLSEVVLVGGLGGEG